MSVSRKLIRPLTQPVTRVIEGGEEGSDPDVTIDSDVYWSDGTPVLWSDNTPVFWSN